MYYQKIILKSRYKYIYIHLFLLLAESVNFDILYNMMERTMKPFERTKV